MSANTSPLLDPVVARDPHAYLADLRERHAVCWEPALGTWFVLRHAEVMATFADPRLSKDRRLDPNYVPPKPGSWSARFDDESLSAATPAEHRYWRKQVSAGFTPRAVRRIEQQVRDVVEDFAAPIRDRRGRIDLVQDFTNPIPNTVIARITGIPPFPGEEERFRRLAQDVLRPFFPFSDEENIRRGEDAISELAEWIDKLAGERRVSPKEDLLSDVVLGNEGDDGLTNVQATMLITSLVAAGSETTTMGTNGALCHLMRHPDQLALLRRDRSLVPNAVREALRYEFGSPFSGTPRYALEDVEIGGQSIKKGDVLMMCTASANRDPRVFDRPDEFDIQRDTRDIVSFGHGPHYCLGANLAMQEMGCMIDAILDLLPAGASLDEDDIEWEQIGMLYRPISLPFDF